MRPAGHGDAGFTLLELLVAIAVMGIVLLLLNQGLQFGLRAAQLQAGVRDRNGDIEAVDHALRRMVALADPGIFPEPATLQGNAATLAFTTELPLHGDGRLQRADVALSAVAGQLRLRWTPYRHNEAFAAPPAWQETVMLDGVERIELAYWARAGSGGWSSVWKAGTLPALIRIRIVFDGSSGRHWPPIVAAPVREALEE